MHTFRLFSPPFLYSGLTLVERVTDAVLEGHYFLVTLQFSIREPAYPLRELLLHFGRQAEHGLWLLCSNLQKPKQFRLFPAPLQLESTLVFSLTFQTNTLTLRLATPEKLGVNSIAGAAMSAE